MRDPFELVGGDYLGKHLPLRSRNRNRIVLGGGGLLLLQIALRARVINNVKSWDGQSCMERDG